MSRPHLKLEINDCVSTSALLIIRKGERSQLQGATPQTGALFVSNQDSPVASDLLPDLIADDVASESPGGRAMPAEVLVAGTRLADQYGTSSEIHPEDYIFWYIYDDPALHDKKQALASYLETGHGTALFLRDVLREPRPAQVLSARGDTISILEFAAGYGRVTRHFPKILPNAEVVACDIHGAAVSFLRALGFDALQSSSVPENFSTGRTFDVVFALSFLTHMPRVTWARWLRSLADQVSPDGLLVFTAHGEVSQGLMGAVALEPDGFYFTPFSEQRDLSSTEYGNTVTTFDYVYAQIQGTGLRLLQFKEAGIGHHDVYILHRPRVFGDARLASKMKPILDEDNSLLKLRSAEAELSAIYGSTSWRVTAPLRAARRFVSGRLGPRVGGPIEP